NSSKVEEILNDDPMGIYKTMDFHSKDYYRHTLEKIAKENKISEMIKESVKNKSTEMSKETLQGLISQELLFNNGLGKQLTDAILERIEVNCKDNKNKIDLKLYLKTTSNEMCFEIERKRACVTSVRYIPYICSGQI
ncbi:MAG: hypothetical protein RSD78_07790, partial [Oscillospiraceae bacterium]